VIGWVDARVSDRFFYVPELLLRPREPGCGETLVSLVSAEPGCHRLFASREPGRQPITSKSHEGGLVALHPGNQSRPTSHSSCRPLDMERRRGPYAHSDQNTHQKICPYQSSRLVLLRKKKNHLSCHGVIFL